MPLFTYFAVVGSLLLGLLYVAEARLGPPKPLAISTSFYGLPPPFKAHRTVAVLTAQDAPAPDMTGMNVQSPVVTQPLKAETAMAQQISAQQISAQASGKKPAKTAQARKSKKAAKVAGQAKGGNQFAHNQQRQYGVVW